MPAVDAQAKLREWITEALDGLSPVEPVWFDVTCRVLIADDQGTPNLIDYRVMVWTLSPLIGQPSMCGFTVPQPLDKQSVQALCAISAQKIRELNRDLLSTRNGSGT